ncbi:RHS repeat protein [Salmonella enterica subsp. enterica serovar Kotte]|nr:RHS repeat protein [Salmonella enterica subsp. enterica serovar Kotte]
MSGKPAARQGDMTQYGGPVVQGSAGVMIGAPTGVACSVCPGGMTSGNPVNPLLGAKVQPGETDFALPGTLPFVLSRTYSSYRTKTPAPAGLFGPGWKAPFDIRLQIRDEELILNDNGGRSIHFDPLFPGETAFSRSESLWLARGGVPALHESNPLYLLWQSLPEDIRASPHVYLATSSLQGPWWILGWAERVPAPDDALPAPLPPYRTLTGLVDNFGHTLAYHRDAAGEFAGEISHLSDGHRVAIHYRRDRRGRLISERQTVHAPETNELLWQHETRHDYSDKGLANRVTPDALPAVEWLTWGSGYLAGMKLGDTPLIDFTRDRLHRETRRCFGDYELTTAYTPGGQLQSHHLNILQLNRDYTWNIGGQLVHISGQHEQRDYQYGDAGRLLGTHITSPHSDLEQWTFTDPAGNRTAARDKYPVLPESFPDNRHRLTHYRQMQPGSVLTESRYLYDPLGRRISKRVRKSQEERDLNGDRYLWLNPTPEVTWYGWDGDRLTTTQTDKTRIQTVYPPGSFTPLIRTETATEELAKTHHRSLAEKLQQDAGMVFVPELVALLDNLERELNAGRVSEQSRQWLAQCGLTPEQMKNQMAPAYMLVRKIHLYHCDHRGLPLALIDIKGRIAWRAEFDEWGNMLREDNPDNLQQLIRLPGQQYDEESGLHYNRHRYYEPGQGRYITQDPIGLKGGWNLYTYPLNPITDIDPLGLITCGVDIGDPGELLRCKMVENNCISKCSFTSLPTKNNGFAFWNCVNECKVSQGC